MNHTWKQTVLDDALYWVLGSIYCWSAVCTVQTMSSLSVSPLLLLGLAAAAMAVWLGLCSHRIVLLCGLGALLAACVFLAVRTSLFQNLFAAFTGQQEFSNQDELHIILLLTLLFALMVTISLKGRMNFYLVILTELLLFCLAFWQGSVEPLAFVGFLFVSAVLVLAKVRSGWTSGPGLGLFLLKALPLGAAVALLCIAATLPMAEHGSSPWGYDSFRNFIDRGLLGDFSRSISFDQTEIVLGMPYDMDPAGVLLVDGPDQINLYGGVADWYTGNSWRKSSKEEAVFQTDYQTVDLATLKSLQASDFNSESIRLSTATITYLQQSELLFTPRLPNSVEALGQRRLYLNRLGEFSVDQPIQANQSVTISFYQDNLQDQYGVSNLSSALRRYNVEQILVERVFNHQNLTLYETWGTSDLRSYLQSIQAQYTQLPDSVTDRTRELAVRLTEGKETPSAQAEAIRAYLASAYTYSLDGTGLGPQEDFVDHFLFESKQGYDQSFASAMVVLCRSVGLPARYVYGYWVPANADESGVHLVRGRNQHAWAEVYLEGYGWCAFEATPPYAYLEEMQVKPGIQIDPDGGESMQTHLGDLGLTTDAPPSAGSSHPNAASSSSADASSTGDTAAQDQVGSQQTYVALWCVAGAAVLLISIVLVRFRMRVAKEHRAMKQSPNAWAFYCWEHLLMLAKYQGHAAKPGETPEDFLDRFALAEPSLAQPLKQAKPLCNQLLYANRLLTADQAQKLGQIYHVVDQYVKKEGSSLRYGFVKYLCHRL